MLLVSPFPICKVHCYLMCFCLKSSWKQSFKTFCCLQRVFLCYLTHVWGLYWVIRQDPKLLSNRTEVSALEIKRKGGTFFNCARKSGTVLSACSVYMNPLSKSRGDAEVCPSPKRCWSHPGPGRQAQAIPMDDLCRVHRSVSYWELHSLVTYLASRSWFLLPFSNEKKPGLLGEIADSRTGAKIRKINPEHLLVPESQEMLYTHTHTDVGRVCRGAQEPAKGAPSG